MPLDGPWVETTLGEHVRLASGGTPSKGNPVFWGDGTPWVTAKDMKSLWIESTEDNLTTKGAEQANWVAPAGTILMLVRGMTLHHDVPIVRLKVPAAFNQDVKAIIPGPAIDPNYLFYLLRSHKPDLLEAVDAAGHGTGRLASDALNRIAISLPSLSEQRVIHEALTAIDEKVELNSAIVSTLEDAAQVLFQSWFVNFDPVHAKAEGRDPGLPADIAALFPDSFGEDGLPEGWAMDKVGALFDIAAGNTPSTFNEGFWGAPHAWATPKDMSSLRSPILDQTSRQLTGAGLAATSSGLVPAGSLLLSSRAPIGYLAFAAMPLAINQGIAAFVKKEISTVYAWAWCQAYMDVIKSGANGSTFQEISKGTLRQLPMLRPTPEATQRFDEITSSHYKRIVQVSCEIDALTQIRDLLLPKLISGEQRIPAAANEVAAA